MIRTKMQPATWLLLLSLFVSSLAAQSFSRPAIMTSIGQSSDIAVLKALLNTKLKLDISSKPVAQPSDLEGQKSLLLVLGASTKGLGAAGLDINKEMERTTALLKTAKEKGIAIIALHTGGEGRRGKTTNDFIERVLPESRRVIVLATGNKDKFFNTQAEKSGIPLTEVESLAAVGEAVKALFQP